MKSSVRRAVRLLASVAAVIAVLGLGFAAARASADPGDQVAEMRRMHEETHATHPGMEMGAHSAAMEDMHQMSARLSEEDRALHDRMHQACGDHAHERSNT